MKQEYLTGTIRDRIADLMKERKITQSELAKKVGTTSSMLSRFLSEKTNKLPPELLIRIARVFNVSTDFLLGVVNEPDPKNYDISELGLSAQAARNLYTAKVCPNVVSRLLENPYFAEASYRINFYFSDGMAKGIAAQNQMYDTVASLLTGAVQSDAANNAAADIRRLKVPMYLADLTNIQNQLMAAVRDIKEDMGSDLKTAMDKTARIGKNIFADVSKNLNLRQPKLTPETFKQMAKSIIRQEPNLSKAGNEAVDELEKSIYNVLMSMPGAPKENGRHIGRIN